MSQRAKAEVSQSKPDAGALDTGPLAIIAGSGALPTTLAEAAVAQGRGVHILGIRGEADEKINRFPHTWLKWGEVGKLFATLEDRDAATSSSSARSRGPISPMSGSISAP